MRGPHNIWRLVQTGATFERSGAMSVAMDALETPKSIRIPIRFLIWPIQFMGLKGETKYPPVLRALIALGPAYIKFGQLLSTRPDVVGTGLADELRILQDALPPFDQKDSIKAIENDLSININEVFPENLRNSSVFREEIQSSYKLLERYGSLGSIKQLMSIVEK